MEEWLHLVTKDVVVIIDTMALIIVAVGTAEAFITGLWVAFPAAAAHGRFRRILIRYGRWLVAGLTFQLAADIVGTSIAPSWQELGQLGAIAVIRTFLNFFSSATWPSLALGRRPAPVTIPVAKGDFDADGTRRRHPAR